MDDVVFAPPERAHQAQPGAIGADARDAVNRGLNRDAIADDAEVDHASVPVDLERDVGGEGSTIAV
jgi:hypothetical protein